MIYIRGILKCNWAECNRGETIFKKLLLFSLSPFTPLDPSIRKESGCI